MVANTTMKILKNVGMLVMSLMLPLLSAGMIGDWYDNIFNISQGFSSFIISSSMSKFLDGLLPSYLFFLFLLFTASGGTKKYWWAGIASIPALAFLIFFDFDHIYFHILFPVAGWLIGWGISKLISKKAEGIVH